MYTENSNLLRSQQMRPRKQILPKQKKLNPVTHLVSPTTPLEIVETMKIIGYPRNIILCNTRQSSVDGPDCSQSTRCIPLSKRKVKKKTGRSFCVSKTICVLQLYFTSKSWRQIWWCVNQHFEYTFYQCFCIYDLRETVLCLCASF